MTNIPNNNLNDSYKQRKAKVGSNTLTIYVENTLPILITKDTVLTDPNTLIRTGNGEANNTPIVGFKDDETDRFIGISTVQSPLTWNKVSLYYDKKWKDIIIVPNLEYYTLTKNGNYDVRAYRLGNNNVLTSKVGTGTLGMEEPNRVLLPEAQEVTNMSTLLTSLSGFHSESFIDTTRLEESVNNFNILHSDRSLSTFIKLGTGSSLFANPSPLTVYLLSQTTIRDFGIESIGLQDISSLNLYVSFRF